ncbi:OmpA family protein [Janthinobacterium sp. SUN137]|uniref:OmpA family protein n=1 Tax=Janthinobacterium sp. SUN137 TaxID=3014789 RepID=UPI0027134D71|nr:OmpA family protein [Janthinobacterium sp. SUN137]MDO8040201.1 OmpA family protein [Janthinobacterium sp. SUN137]
MIIPSPPPEAAPVPTYSGDSLSKKIAILDLVTTLTYKLAVAVGAIVTLTYLFDIQFFPSSLTPGEVVFFIFVALMFGFLYCIFLLFGAMSAVWLLQLCSWLEKRVSRRYAGCGQATLFVVPAGLRGVGYCLVSLFFFLLSLLYAFAGARPSLFLLILIFFCAGFLTLFLGTAGTQAGITVAGAQPKPQRRLAQLAAVFVAPLVLVLFFGPFMKMVHMAFQLLGVRIPDVSIEVPETELGEIERVTEVVGRPILDCRRSAGGRLLVHHADVLWTGVGGVSLVTFSVRTKPEASIFSPEPVVLKVATLRLDAATMRIIKSRPVLNPCFDLSNDLLFKTGSEQLLPTVQPRLQALASAILASGTPHDIMVRGHSDARPFAGSIAGKAVDNQRLSELRAEAIVNVLRTALDGKNLTMRSEGAGAREPRVKCPVEASTTAYETEQCNALNRRVEVRVLYAQTQ